MSERSILSKRLASWWNSGEWILVVILLIALIVCAAGMILLIRLGVAHEAEALAILGPGRIPG